MWQGLPGWAGGTPQTTNDTTRRAYTSTDCEPDWRDGTLPHHKHYIRLRPVLPGQEHGEETPELPGNVRIVLSREQLAAWLSPHTFFFFGNILEPLKLRTRRRSPAVAGSSCRTDWALCMNEGGGVPLQKAEPGVWDGPCRSGDHLESLELFTWWNRRAARPVLLMNVHIATMYVWLCDPCDGCMVNIALLHCRSYLLNLICSCVCLKWLKKENGIMLWHLGLVFKVIFGFFLHYHLYNLKLWKSNSNLSKKNHTLPEQLLSIKLNLNHRWVELLTNLYFVPKYAI